MNRVLAFALGVALLLLCGLCLAYTLTVYQLAGDGAEYVGFLLGLLWAAYGFAALVAFGSMFARGRASLRMWLTPWRAAYGLGALGFCAALPLAIAGGFGSNRAAVALVSFLLGVLPVVALLIGERLGMVDEEASADADSEELVDEKPVTPMDSSE